jgi:hypothetical protein
MGLASHARAHHGALSSSPQVESCWTGEAGARKCLDQALHLVGLNDGPLGDQGVEIMVGEKQKIAKEHKVIASDCV